MDIEEFVKKSELFLRPKWKSWVVIELGGKELQQLDFL